MCSLFDLLFEVLGVVGPEWHSDVRSQCTECTESQGVATLADVV